MGASFTNVPGGTAHWIFTGNGNYNNAEGEVAITINAWTFSGFYQPVDMSGATTVYNTVKSGSTVPFKFEVFKGSAESTSTTDIKPIVAKSVSCVNTAPIDDIELLATGGTVLRYDNTAGQFVYNWQTSGKAGTCYSVTISSNDGSSKTAYFKLK